MKKNKNTQNCKIAPTMPFSIGTLIIGVYLLFGICQMGFSQNVGINTDNPDNSALLELESSERGLLIPRMTTTQRDAIDLAGNQQALLIYNNTDNCLQIYDETEGWQNVYCIGDCSPESTSQPSNSSICEGENTSFSVIATGTNLSYQWQVDDGGGWADITAAGSNPTYADYTTSSLSVNSVVASNDAYQYQCVVSGDCAPGATSNAATLSVNTTPSAPTAGTHVPGEEQIEWNWNTVADADGYAYNTVDDYSTATDNGTSTSYTQTSLTCETAYTLYVWAYNDCGESSSVELSETTSDCPFSICGESTVVDVTNSTTGKTWMDRNLGASQQATSSDDYNAYGALFQWGRLSDGHECITWTGSSSGTPDNGTTSTTSSDDDPDNGGLFITAGAGSDYDWRDPQNDDLWQGVSGTNNPCPSGYRLPTEAELTNEMNSWSSEDADGAYGSPLKLPAAGERRYDFGSLVGTPGSRGYYWSSTVAGTY